MENELGFVFSITWATSLCVHMPILVLRWMKNCHLKNANCNWSGKIKVWDFSNSGCSYSSNVWPFKFITANVHTSYKFCYYVLLAIWIPAFISKGFPHSINRLPVHKLKHTKSNQLFSLLSLKSSSVLVRSMVIERGASGSQVFLLQCSFKNSLVVVSWEATPIVLCTGRGGVIVLRTVCGTHDSTLI